MQDKNTCSITNVYYAKNIKNNILILVQLLEKCFNIHIKNLSLNLRDENGTLITSIKMTKNIMFPLLLHVTQGNYFKATIRDNLILWHLRYGHLNFEALKLLERNHMLRIESPSKICETPVMSKQASKKDV